MYPIRATPAGYRQVHGSNLQRRLYFPHEQRQGRIPAPCHVFSREFWHFGRTKRLRGDLSPVYRSRHILACPDALTGLRSEIRASEEQSACDDDMSCCYIWDFGGEADALRGDLRHVKTARHIFTRLLRFRRSERRTGRENGISRISMTCHFHEKAYLRAIFRPSGWHFR